MENLAVIIFKKRTMTFENCDTRVITPLDPREGKRYAKPIKDEVMGGWDNSYNIYKDYIKPTADVELGWRSISSAYSDYDDVLENW